MLNLAGVFSEGRGKGQFAVQADTERAVQIIERAMQLKIPAAFDAMGTFHQRGIGVRSDSSRAFAFWQLAAEMGNADAQAHIGYMLLGGFDNPKELFWANRAIGERMLECAVSQGNARGAYNLGMLFRTLNKNFGRAMEVLQIGVRNGCADCADSLSIMFEDAKDLPSGVERDRARGERYGILSDALYYNRDLRFPNLDKILPLPPAPLPKWDGDKKKLIDAAKAVVPIPPKPPASAASQRTGRAHMPEGYVLPAEPQHTSAPRYESTNAGLTGYWLPQLVHSSTLQHAAWNAAQVPLRYEAHETFESARHGLEDADGRVVFHYLGVPVVAPPMHALPAPTRSKHVRRRRSSKRW
jgi:hypothetical protein